MLGRYIFFKFSFSCVLRKQAKGTSSPGFLYPYLLFMIVSKTMCGYLEPWEVTRSLGWASQPLFLLLPLHLLHPTITVGRPFLSPSLCLTSSVTWGQATHLSMLS